MKNKLSTVMTGWIILLIFELFWFSNLTHEVHDQDEVLFIMTIVFVTLIVGAVWLLLTVLTSKRE
jgi:hypothetical protein